MTREQGWATEYQLGPSSQKYVCHILYANV
jgi:hypothetical protein